MFHKIRAAFVLVLFVLAVGVMAQDMSEPQPVETQTVQQFQVDHGGARFLFDARLAATVSVTDIPAATAEFAMIPSPAFTEFTFDGYFTGVYLNYAPMPRIDIFPIADFGAYPHFIEELDELSQILAERPDLNQYVVASPGLPDSPQLPALPIFNAAQVFRAKPEYIEVPGIEGIRYLVYYSQAMNPIAEGEIFYTFQGITEDGQHYVSAVLPVNTGTIPAEAPAIDDPDTFAQQYQQYLTDVLGGITAADGETFSPPLSMLDRMVQSITVQR